MRPPGVGRRLRLWPRSLAGRLVLLLVATLALAQALMLALVRSEQDMVVEGLVRGQALTQAVTLARLLDTYPAADSERLAAAFRTREICAWVADTPPPARTMTAAETGLADILRRMLHGVRAGAPAVAIAPPGSLGRGSCSDADATWLPRQPDDRPEGRLSGFGRRRLAAADIVVPLSGGRTLTLRTAVAFPPGWNRLIFLSFLVSSLAVALVTVIGVRVQTRALRALADASERFGRGESVAPLPVAGPAEVAAVTRAFNTMQNRLSQFIGDRLKLLAGIGHDLRTPLTTLRLKAEFIDDPAVRDDIVATIGEMTAICEATLAFTRAEAAAEATGPVDLTALAREIVEDYRLAGAAVSLAPGPAVAVTGRPVALRRAVRNLIDNAVRYGRQADVTVTALPGGGAVLAVEDEGPGVPAARVEEAYTPFVRLEASRSTETGGIGLGLAITRGIVQAHGGVLTLKNRPQGGLRAEIRLPR